jgi:hypothetical protein
MTERSRRDLVAVRYETCWHESGHATVGFLLGQRIERIDINVGDHDLGPDEPAGQVIFEPRLVEDIHQLEDRIVHFLAGEAALRQAWASGAVPDERLELPTRTEAPQLTAENLLVVPAGSTPETHAVYMGYMSAAAASDEENAWKLATKWPSSPALAPMLMAWSRARTAGILATDRCQTLGARLAGHLVEHGSMGSLAHSLLERWNETYTEPLKEEHDVTTQ